MPDALKDTLTTLLYLPDVSPFLVNHALATDADLELELVGTGQP